MQRILIIGLLVGIFLTGCVLIQQFSNAEPTPTQVIELTETLEPTIIPSVTPSVTPSPAVTKVVATPAVNIATPTLLIADNVVAATPVVSEALKYVTQAGSPRWLPNFSHPDSGCNFLGVAGQAFDLGGTPVNMLVVEAGGFLEGKEFFALSLTGNETVYGPGGYEVVIADHVIESNDSVWIQVLNLQSEPLTEKIYFDTFADCQQNLVLINFVESGFYGEHRLYFPVIFR